MDPLEGIMGTTSSALETSPDITDLDEELVAPSKGSLSDPKTIIDLYMEMQKWLNKENHTRGRAELCVMNACNEPVFIAMVKSQYVDLEKAYYQLAAELVAVYRTPLWGAVTNYSVW